MAVEKCQFFCRSTLLTKVIASLLIVVFTQLFVLSIKKNYLYHELEFYVSFPFWLLHLVQLVLFQLLQISKNVTNNTSVYSLFRFGTLESQLQPKLRAVCISPYNYSVNRKFSLIFSFFFSLFAVIYLKISFGMQMTSWTCS